LLRFHSRLKIVLTTLIKCHALFATDEVSPDGQQCYVTQSAPKAKQSLVMCEMKTHEFNKNPDEPTKENLCPTRYVLSKRYAVLCYAVWYLLNVENLVAHKYLAWQDKQLKRDPAFRDKHSSDAAVQQFTKKHTQYIAEVHEEVVARFAVVCHERDVFEGKKAAATK
jgi:hypothetical protein